MGLPGRAKMGGGPDQKARVCRGVERCRGKGGRRGGPRDGADVVEFAAGDATARQDEVGGLERGAESGGEFGF